MLNKKKKFRMFFLVVITIVLIITSLYVYQKSQDAVIPNCRATLKINISDPRSDLRGYYLLSVIPNEHDQEHHSFMMNGMINSDGVDYAISRKFLVKHIYQGDHFFLRIENIFIDPSDQAQYKIKIRGIPQLDQIYFVKIKRLNDENYIFEENFSPLFICTL